MTPEELLANCTVAADMEVPDSRFAKWFPSLSKYLVMSDCAVGGYVVYGTPVDGAELTVEGMAGYTGKCYHDGQLVKQGKSFKRGMHASVGTVFVPPMLEAGKWVVEYDGPFGSVELTVK